jgi:TonB-dependent receptor
LPFEQWSGTDGYVKAGVFRDHVDRKFNQDTFSNFGDSGSSFGGSWDDSWSEEFPDEPGHAIIASLADVDYQGAQTISAWYGMLDLPLTTSVSVIGGARVESTEIGIVNDAEQDALWYPPNATAPVSLQPGDADVSFAQDDVLPSIGLVYEPIESVTLRGAYSQTVARQTFKELTPILQQEFLGGPVFIGNPDLRMSELQNYDLRVDFRPYEGGLISLSWFDKHLEDAIEYVQRPTDQPFTTPVNYPKGELSGYELEVRQDLGHFWEACEGLSVGANGTFIDSEVTLPSGEAAALAASGIQAPMPTRDMTNAPEHLYNLFATYDVPDWGTQIGLFYTVQGDTLVAGAGEALGNFVPNLYAKEYDTLNLSVSQKLGKYFKLQFQAKNLTNPSIDEVYRSEFIGDDVRKTSFTRGIDYSISLSAEFSF